MEGSHSYVQIKMYRTKYAKIAEKELQEHNIVTKASIMLHTDFYAEKSVSVCIGNFMQKVKEDTTREKNHPEPVLRQDQPKRQSSGCLDRYM